MLDPRTVILDVLEAVKHAADPAAAVTRHWPTHLDHASSVKLLAAGKASMAMTRAVLPRLGSRLSGGVVVTVPQLAAELPGLTVLPAEHPFPTDRNIHAAAAVEAFARSCSPGDRVLVLLSGGASAHLTSPASGITLDELRSVTRDLQRSGASIRELNAVRKHVETLKGGRLAEICRAGRIDCMVLSDVIGDPLDVIGSGPLAPDPTTYAEAREILLSRNISAPAIQRYLAAGMEGIHPETPKPGNSDVLSRVQHTIVANNTSALEAAAAAARSRGITVASVTPAQEGEAAQLAHELVERLRAAANSHRDGATLVLCGGEPTVSVTTAGDAAGLGGPSQELALAAAHIAGRSLALSSRAWFFAYSTDGVDGPTDAAGAILGPEQMSRMSAEHVARELATHNAHGVLTRLDAHLRTGPTGTNVNHVWGALLLS